MPSHWINTIVRKKINAIHKSSTTVCNKNNDAYIIIHLFSIVKFCLHKISVIYTRMLYGTTDRQTYSLSKCFRAVVHWIILIVTGGVLLIKAILYCSSMLANIIVFAQKHITYYYLLRVSNTLNLCMV